MARNVPPGFRRNTESRSRLRPLLGSPVGSSKTTRRWPIYHTARLRGQPRQQERVQLCRDVLAMNGLNVLEFFGKNARSQRENPTDPFRRDLLAADDSCRVGVDRNLKDPPRHTQVFGAQDCGGLGTPVSHNPERSDVVDAGNHDDHESCLRAALARIRRWRILARAFFTSLWLRSRMRLHGIRCRIRRTDRSPADFWTLFFLDERLLRLSALRRLICTFGQYPDDREQVRIHSPSPRSR